MTWSCLDCTLLNEDDFGNCFACYTVRGRRQVATSNNEVTETGPSWQCSRCTLLHDDPNLAICELCHQSRSDPQSSGVLQVQSPPPPQQQTSEFQLGHPTSSPLPPPSSPPLGFECTLCTSTSNPRVRFGSCDVMCCVECAQGWIEAQATSDRTGRMWCPQRCHELSYTDLMGLVGQGAILEPLLSRVKRLRSDSDFRLSSLGSPDTRLRICSNMECRELWMIAPDEAILACRTCGTRTCTIHGAQLERRGGEDVTTEMRQLPTTREINLGQRSPLPHLMRDQRAAPVPVLVCTHCVREANSVQAYELDEAEMARLDTKPCPNCQVPIHRIEGCRHMTCSQCGHEWFWCCSRSYRDRHEASLHCRQCT